MIWVAYRNKLLKIGLLVGKWDNYQSISVIHGLSPSLKVNPSHGLLRDIKSLQMLQNLFELTRICCYRSYSKMVGFVQWSLADTFLKWSMHLLMLSQRLKSLSLQLLSLELIILCRFLIRIYWRVMNDSFTLKAMSIDRLN